MRANEIITEGVMDSARAALYRTTGIGGDAGNQIANKVKFIDGFKEQLRLAQGAAKTANMPFDVLRMVNAYLAKYGWTVDTNQQQYLKDLTTSPVGKPLPVKPDVLANAVYSIGMQQSRDADGYVTSNGGYSQAGGSYSGGRRGRKGSKAAQPQELSVTTEKIVDTIGKLVGPENLDDLAAIAKQAMKVLYGQDKEKYTELYKEIMTGQKAEPEAAPLSPEEQIAQKRKEKLKAAAAAANAGASPFTKFNPKTEPSGENPNLVRGTNESRKRK